MIIYAAPASALELDALIRITNESNIAHWGADTLPLASAVTVFRKHSTLREE
jgi:hypothetical protein